MGEAARKAGTLLNFAVGGEGRGYTDASGNFIPRRRPRPELPRLRQSPLFAGDALVDELPTLTDIYEFAVGSPARGRKLPPPGRLLRTGRLDALDSVARNAPSVIGAAFNNRLLLGGFAGEPDESPGGLNPFGFTAVESVALLLLDAHRMLDFQSAELQKLRTYQKLFRDAFPEEAAQADAAGGDLNLLINDLTVLRATASFLRTAVTRNTPWDRFLAGENGALTVGQRRGARLFFLAASDGGAGCYSCHSGPMLNKQVNDSDVAGAGQFVEENFFNLGLADHPLQALNIVARMDPNFRDDGRREITARDRDAFKFRVLTLRQLRDGKFFFHNGSFTRVKDVVQYFNRGVPQDAGAAAAGTLTPRFTNPRGPGSPSGLGLDENQVNDLTDFLENALYDPAFVRFDPHSTTRTMEPNEQDLIYSIFRPDLAALGAVDGRMPSGLPRSNNDVLSRRDMGLEFLDVTRLVNTVLIESNRIGGGRQEDVHRITNNSSSIVDTHLLMVVEGLSGQVRMENASGIASTGDPYLRVFLPNGVLLPGQSIVTRLLFRQQPQLPMVTYGLTLLSGQGNP
jgi:cytochrome c peroxidase